MRKDPRQPGHDEQVRRNHKFGAPLAKKKAKSLKNANLCPIMRMYYAQLMTSKRSSRYGSRRTLERRGPEWLPRPPRQEIGDGDKTGSALANLRGRLSPARSHKTPRRGLTAKVALIAFAVGWRLVSVPAAPLPSWPGLSRACPGHPRGDASRRGQHRPPPVAESYRTRPSDRAARFRSFVAPNRVDGRDKPWDKPHRR